MTTITQTLDATCNVVFPVCNSLMDSLARQIREDGNCGQDYDNENPLVRQAYNGLLSYGVLYNAGCLKDNSGSYCFADAITNTSSPTDSYIYHLPLGMSLPGGSRPTCSSCLQQTMGLFAQTAENASQPINIDYVTAAEQVDLGCGPTFANQTISVIKGSEPSAASMSFMPPVGMLAIVAMVVLGQWLQ